MNKIYTSLLLLLSLMCGMRTEAQLNYTFSAVPGTYSSITGTSPTINSGTDDGYTNSISLPFTFTYNGSATYNSFSASTNGFIALGSTLATSYNGNDLTNTGGANRPIIAPLWDDLLTASMTYTTTGPVGSRVFTMQWNDVKWYYSATTNTLSMQARLFEGTNVIEFAYAPTGNLPSTASGSIGITAIATGSPNFISLTNTSNSPGTSTTSETTTLSAVPANTIIYRFTPSCSSPLAAGTATSTSASYNCSGSPALNLTSGTTPGSGIQYVWQSSPAGANNWTNLSGILTSPAFTSPSITSSKDYRCVTTCTFSGLNVTSSVVTVTVTNPSATLSGSPSVCAGNFAQITVSFANGTAPYSITYTDGVTPQTLNNINTNPYSFSVTPTITTGYTLVSMSDANCSGTVSGSAIANVNPLPIAAINATSSVICAGQNVDIIFSGTPNATVNYYEDGNLQSSVLDNSGFYTINLTPTSGGNISYVPFSVESTDGCIQSLTSSPPVNITVNASPSATITNSGPSTVCAGTPSTVEINLGGSAGPWTFTYSDGTNTITETNYGGSTFPINSTLSATTTYSITALTDDVNLCAAQSADISDDETITVEHPAAIATQPQSVTECTGGTATLAVIATGNGLSYQWTVNSTPINSNDPFYSGSNQATLTIPDVSGVSGNLYAVVVSGSCGSPVTSNTVTITEDLVNTWNGATSNAWSDATNWSCGTIPVITTNVVIPSAPTNQPWVDITGAICNNMTVNAGALLMFTGVGNQLAVHGDLLNNGTLDADGGKIMLAGSATQQVSGVTAFDDLEIEGGSAKTLANDIVVNGILTLTDGFLVLDDNDLTISDMTLQNTGNAASFVVTNDSGLVIGQNMGNTPVMFPIGFNSNTYTPVMLENEGDADTFSVRVIEHVYMDGYGTNTDQVMSPVVDRTWLVTEQTAGGSYVNMTPYWNVAQEINGFDQTHVYVGHYNNGQWNALTDDVSTAPAAVLSGSLYTAYADSIEEFSPFTVASSGQFPLSIDKLTLTGRQQGENVILNWTTINEKDVRSFDVERSIDGKNFTKLGNKAATGTDNLLANNYSFTDFTAAKLQTDKIYYRLRILENDGVGRFSNVITVNMVNDDAPVVTLYPNPVSHGKDVVYISIDNSYQGAISIKLTDMYGKTIAVSTVAEGQFNSAAIPFDIKSISAGIYMLHVSDKNNREMQVFKFVKQ